MENQIIVEKNPGWLKRNAIIIGIVWTLIIAGLLGWNLRDDKKHLLASVTGYARSAYNKDVVYRRWVAKHGGVYVPPTAQTPPNPYLAKLPHRDVTTTDGTKLTLVNPAYMTRQVFALGKEQYGYRGHITSLKPLRPENRPDPWEKKALTAFEAGASEVVEIRKLDGDRYLRLMRPLVTEQGCLKCHADQGYKLGDIRGGVSVSINLEPILAAAADHWWDIGFTYGAIWLLGLLGIGFTFSGFNKHFQQLEAQKILLQESRDRFQKLQQRNENILLTAGEGIIGLDDKRKPIFVNPAAAEMLGFSQEELLGQDCHETWHRLEEDIDSPGQNPCQICLAMEAKKGKVRIVDTLFRQDGSSFPAELTISPMLEGSELIGAVVVFMDITERLKNEKQLSLLAAVVEQTDAIVVIFDHQGSILYLNPVFEHVTGYLVSEAQGKNVHEIFAPDLEHDRSRQELKSHLLRGEAWHGTLQSKKKDGTIFYEETISFPIQDDHGRIIGYAKIKHDISARKKMEQQLAQASKMESIGQLAGGVAHDFNNILTVINGYAQLVLMKLEKDSKLWHDVREIEKAGGRAAALTRQLLAFSRKQLIMPKALRVNDEIAEMEKMIRRLIGEDIELEVSLAENLPLIYADPSQLQQILMNLTVNARDALQGQIRDAGKRIKISTSRKFLDDGYVAMHSGSSGGWHVQIQVEDNGAGMAKEVADHIFEPFYTTKAVGEGTGMGLATVYGIVKQNQGSIYVYSEPGQGTIFKIFWPIMAAEVTKIEDEASTELAVGGKETILLVEDDAGMRKLISRQLSNAGYTVIEAENGRDALEQAGNHQGTIDLLFTDVILPIMGGKELAEKIKDIFPDIPVLFGSGYTDDKLPEDILLLAQDHFINKPYDLKEVMARIRSLLDDRQV